MPYAPSGSNRKKKKKKKKNMKLRFQMTTDISKTADNKICFQAECNYRRIVWQ
jgi:hypothetical protein